MDKHFPNPIDRKKPTYNSHTRDQELGLLKEEHIESCQGDDRSFWNLGDGCRWFTARRHNA